MQIDDDDNIAVLVGNGLSVAFNPELNLQRITTEVLQRIRHASGDDVIAAMKEIADQALPKGVTDDGDFEQLVGAFGSESRTLGLLSSLAELTAPADKELLRSIKRVANFAEQVRDNGISHVLEVIAERSHAYVDEAEHLHSLIQTITEEFEGSVTFGNLNYDTLLLAALLQVCPRGQVADMGHGLNTAEVTVGDSITRTVQRLRRTAREFPDDYRIKLLHLHGSLTFWSTPDEEVYVKLPREMVDGDSQWRAMREQTTNIRPAVVLANQRDKADYVTRDPFKLAYEMFGKELQEADRWLIIGYSFRDTPINIMLQREFTDRFHKPKVCVVTHGNKPTRKTVERALGWGAEDAPSEEWLTISRDGANGFQNTQKWDDFITD